MQSCDFNCTRPLEESLLPYRWILAVAVLVTAFSAEASQTSYLGGASLDYRLDDNLNVSADNQIGLGGWILGGFIKGNYASDQLRANANLDLDFERYNQSSIDTENAALADPDPSAFDSDNQDLKAAIDYDWKLHTIGVSGRYWRDSTLNTQFLDTGIDGLREIEGATRRIESKLGLRWGWKMTPRQNLATSVTGRTVDYESDKYIGYEYASLGVNWEYVLTERFQFKISPYYSWFKNEADISVKSQTFGLRGGFDWLFARKWSLDLLAGGARVYSEYGQGGLVVTDPDTGTVEFVEDQDSNSFIGNVGLRYTDLNYGFGLKAFSKISPSANGILRQNNQARLTFFWRPAVRLRIDLDSRVGNNNSTDERIENGRVFGEAGFRLSYSIAKEWWLSARYRFRVQDFERSTSGVGKGNSIYASLSYRLPKEIL